VVAETAARIDVHDGWWLESRFFDRSVDFRPCSIAVFLDVPYAFMAKKALATIHGGEGASTLEWTLRRPYFHHLKAVSNDRNIFCDLVLNRSFHRW
jgi:hypothetical protein